MRLRIIIDALAHEIDSTDPDLIGKWIMEIFGRAARNGITPATMIQMQASPSWIPDRDSPHGGHPDWYADSRVMGRVYDTPTPRDLVATLAAIIDEAETLT